jgi:hypothetical protein
MDPGQVSGAAPKLSWGVLSGKTQAADSFAALKGRRLGFSLPPPFYSVCVRPRAS